MGESTGVFTISLDTELAWGTFDTPGATSYHPAFERTPQVIDRLCSLFDEHRIPATWAIVAHLFEDCTDDPNPHQELTAPSYEWIDDWFQQVPCVREWPKDIWYAPNLVDRLNDCRVDHELALHGYTHVILGEDGCSQEAATDELSTAVEVAQDNGFDPSSYVFPRNEVGHCDVLSEHGIDTYRGPTKRPLVPPSLPDFFRKPLRFLVETATITPRTVIPRQRGDLVEIPGSQIFRPSHGAWQHTPRHSQSRRARKALERAAETGDIFHLWFHPFNLAMDGDMLLSELESILEKATTIREEGRLEIMTMEQIAHAFRQGRWTENYE